MPTLTRLVALVLFAFLAYIAGDRYITLFDPSEGLPAVPVVWLAVVGGAVGWQFVGGRVGAGSLQSIWIGLQGVVLAIFWALVLLGGAEMVARSHAQRYDGVMEAVIGWFEIALEHLTRMGGSVDFLILLAAGGAICGLLSGLFFRYAEKRRKG